MRRGTKRLLGLAASISASDSFGGLTEGLRPSRSLSPATNCRVVRPGLRWAGACRDYRAVWGRLKGAAAEGLDRAQPTLGAEPAAH